MVAESSKRLSCNPTALHTVGQGQAWSFFFFMLFSFLCHFLSQFQQMYKYTIFDQNYGGFNSYVCFIENTSTG